MNLGRGEWLQVVQASTLFGEPFADLKPQKIGVSMTLGTFKLTGPSPGRPERGRVSDMATNLSDPDAFAHDALQALALACLDGLEPAMRHIQAWRDAGHSLEDIYIEAVAPCARLLGQWWLDDVLDFAQITVASAHLQRILQRLSPEFCAPGHDHPVGRSVLLVTEPQSQHTLGACMVSEFFRRRGWEVQLATPQDGEEVLGLLRRNWFDALGLSVGSDRQLQALSALMPRLRAESPNPRLCVLVGGALALARPEALQALGADMVVGDARETVNLLSHLLLKTKV